MFHVTWIPKYRKKNIYEKLRLYLGITLRELAKQKEWKVLKQFVGELKQTLLEATFEVDSLAEIRRYKHLIRGMESVILLPELVNLVKEMEKDDKAEKLEKEQEAKRRKYNPGAIVRSAMDKVRKIK